MWDQNYKWVDVSVDAVRAESIRRAQEGARLRAERIRERREEASRQMVERAQPAAIVNHNGPAEEGAAGLVWLFREKLQRTGATLRLFHFTLHFGRLRIELVRAAGQKK